MNTEGGVKVYTLAYALRIWSSSLGDVHMRGIKCSLPGSELECGRITGYDARRMLKSLR